MTLRNRKINAAVNEKFLLTERKMVRTQRLTIGQVAVATMLRMPLASPFFSFWVLLVVTRHPDQVTGIARTHSSQMLCVAAQSCVVRGQFVRSTVGRNKFLFSFICLCATNSRFSHKLFVLLLIHAWASTLSLISLPMHGAVAQWHSVVTPFVCFSSYLCPPFKFLEHSWMVDQIKREKH